MHKIHIVTVATESKYYFPYLIESCKKNNIELTVLGFDEKWQGFNWRLNLMREFLVRLPQDDIICFVDGYDVICTRDLNELKDSFYNIKNKTKCKIIVGYHRIESHIAHLIVKFFFNGELNAGTYIGECKDLLDMFENISDRDNSSDDQQLLNEYNNQNKNIIHIDKDGELFGTIMSSDINPSSDVSKYYLIENNKVYIKRTNKRPFFIHGPSNSNLSIILEKLNYNPDKTIPIQLKKEYKDKLATIINYRIINLKNKYNHIIKKIIVIVIIFILVVFFTNL